MSLIDNNITKLSPKHIRAPMIKATGSIKSKKLIFISHANPNDNDFTAWLSARLASDGYEVWSDLTHLVGGEVFWKDESPLVY